MNDDQIAATRRGPTMKRAAIGVAIVATVCAAGVVVGAGVGVKTQGTGSGKAKVVCPGGMSRLGHEFSEDMSIFPFDPAIEINNVYTVADDFFKVEAIQTGAHAGTHLDVPAHFIEGGRTLDQLAAEEFVWPAYKIDVRGMSFTDDFVEIADIEAYEDEHGEIKKGSLVILQTGAEEFFGISGDDVRDVTVLTEVVIDPETGDPVMQPVLDDNGNTIVLADNTDDLFGFENAGFSFDAVQWLFEERDIDGVGSDAYGPDAATDVNFDATYATLLNDGVALVALANLDSVSVNKDVIMASAVALQDGSGFSTDPIACHGKKKKNND